MSSSLYQTLNISRQDMLNRLLDLDLTSNNIANINTNGFKTSRSNFQEMLIHQLKGGVQMNNTQVLTGQGNLQDSQNPLDLAIQGNGYFSVKLQDGTTGYTRNGQFKMDANRNLVTPNGYLLVMNGTIPDGTTSVIVNQDGSVVAISATGVSATVATIQLTRFPNAGGLLSRGENTWLESAASGKPTSGASGSPNLGIILGNKMEQSNVNLAQEFTHLMSVQRSITISSKVFQQTDTMIAEAINLRKG